MVNPDLGPWKRATSSSLQLGNRHKRPAVTYAFTNSCFIFFRKIFKDGNRGATIMTNESALWWVVTSG